MGSGKGRGINADSVYGRELVFAGGPSSYETNRVYC